MKKIRPMSAAGKFYPSEKKELQKHFEYFEKITKKDYDYSSRAIIVPHAGYMYSGQLAFSGFQYLDKKVKNIFVFGPPHYVPVKDISLSSYEKWETPKLNILGEIEINQVINQELIEKFGCEYQDDAFELEHSIEVQIPFIQHFLPKVKIIPILVGNIEKVAKIIDYYWENKENAFVISSDLSHFHTSEEAKKIDHITAEMIESKDIEKFVSEQACGSVGICGLVNFAKEKQYSLVRVGLYNSGDITGDNSGVVGYGSWLLYEGAKNEFIKKYFSDYVIDVCKNSILSKLDDEEFGLSDIPAVFGENGASFVTLEKNGELRGCIGSIISHRPLVDDIVQNARNSAFLDPRFNPLKKEEFEELSINVSLLSVPEKMEFKDEDDLLNQIRPNVDGLIIKDGNNQAVYLPSVWEQISEKDLFLKSLKIKAGMTPSHFSKTFEACRYTTEYIKSE